MKKGARAAFGAVIPELPEGLLQNISGVQAPVGLEQLFECAATVQAQVLSVDGQLLQQVVAETTGRRRRRIPIPRGPRSHERGNTPIARLRCPRGISVIKCWWLPRNPARVLEFEPDFERRSSFGDAGWADHTVPDVQGHLRVHADILINSVRRHRQAS